jgi:hypothetical protein
MNAMGHDVPTTIGVDFRDVAKRIERLVPGYMAMGERGMADMGEMEMELPANTLPMMTGRGPFGPIEMGGMFTVVKVREGLAANDYRDPGWYAHPPGTVAREWTGEAFEAPRVSGDDAGHGHAAGQPAAQVAAQGAAPTQVAASVVEVQVRKPGMHRHH